MSESILNFAENLKQEFSESCYALAAKNKETNEEYKQASENYRNLFDTIRDKSGKDLKLMLRPEELYNRLGSMDDERVYLQDFIDCVYLLKFINLI